MEEVSPAIPTQDHQAINNKRSTDSPPVPPSLSKQIKLEGKQPDTGSVGPLSARSTPEPSSILKREHRDKRESWKKREARGESVENNANTSSNNNNGIIINNDTVASDTPFRIYALTYKQSDVEAVPRLPVFASLTHADIRQSSYEELKDINLHVLEEIPFNRRGFRYIPCCTDPKFAHTIYRQIEIPPYKARINFQDISPHIFVDSQGTIASTDKGFRSARANVAFREGEWYFEFEILRGNIRDQENDHTATKQNGTAVSGESTPSLIASTSTSGHVRLGISRREANLETPVGYDVYSYGIRDKQGQKVHISRPSNFMPEEQDGFTTGDVIGFHIKLPPLRDELPKSFKTSNVIRERIPIKYKGQSYFETLEYRPTKEMNELLNPASVTAAAARESAAATVDTKKLSSSHENEQPPDHLEGSFINVYKNGELMGTAFENLLSFMPPWYSRPYTHLTTHSADDGMAGYFPTLSVFGGGAVKMNLGPEFTAPPQGLQVKSEGQVLPASDRFYEQIAEDVVWDIIDEVYFSILDEEQGKIPTGLQQQQNNNNSSSRLSTESKNTPPIKEED